MKTHLTWLLGIVAITSAACDSTSEQTDDDATEHPALPDPRVPPDPPVSLGAESPSFVALNAKPEARGASGSLDRAFGDKGIAITSFDGDVTGLRSLAVLANGGIVAVGGGADDFEIARFASNGKIDGKTTTSFPTSHTGWTYATSVGVLSDGRFVVAGNVDLHQIASVRYLADGSIDTTYATNGRSLTAPFGTDDRISSATLDADGRLVGAGYSLSNAYHTLVGRSAASGALDPSFANGVQPVNPVPTTFNDFGTGVVVDSFPSIYVSVQRSDRIDELSVMRLNADGSRATWWGNGQGIATASTPGGGIAQPTAMSLTAQPGGIYVAGNVAGTTDTWITRIVGSGSPDFSFGNSGGVITLPKVGTGGDSISAVAVQADGKVLIAGWTYDGTQRDFLVMRLLANGSLDTSFGNGGIVVTDIGGSQRMDGAAAIAVAPDGKIIVGGWATGSDGQKQFALARYWP